MNKFRAWTIALAQICALLLFAATLFAQTTTTGDLSGTIADPTGAVIPNAQITIKNADTGATQTTKANSTGFYKFSLLQPGTYDVTATASGFQSVMQQVRVSVGSSVSTDLHLALSSGHEVVEVSGQAATIETEDANINTTFEAKQIELLPNPGNDMSAVALTTPGTVMNTAGGAMFGGGNFEVYGLPATSNLFTVDGANYNDPYFNINNTGATNLSLGLNDVEESNVVLNGYSGSYGGLAGANVNYSTKSGTNAFHGNAIWWWNGSVLDANDYFRDQKNGLAGKNVDPVPFVNANQWATSIGGPIKKNKAFFFFDYEGIKLAIPSPVQFNVPTTAFGNAIISNLNSATGANLPNSVPFYQHLFSLYGGVSQAGASALPAGTDPANNAATGPGCADVSPSTEAAFVAFSTAPCAVQVAGGGSAKTHDVFYAGRVDINLSNSDKLFVRTEHEHGLQATYTDPISSVFNAQSDQPQWQANLQETHTFGSDKVNTFNSSLLWYSAGFALTNPSAALSPTTGLAGVDTIGFLDGSLQALGGLDIVFPQGRNITQYQFVDDFSWVHGRHNFKVGANFRRDDISDQNFTILNPYILEFSLDQFANGGGASFDLQNFPTHTEVPIALYQLGVYAADDVRVSNKLKLTLSVRLDHLSNPVCQTNCFQRLTSSFDTVSHTGPVNAAIASGQHQAFPSVTAIAVQPKIGFAYALSQKTVLRGGIGIFADSLPTGAIDGFLQQAPLDLGFAEVNVAPIAPVEAGSVNSVLAAQAAGFKANYSGGALSCGVPGSTANCVPQFSFENANKGIVPRYYEWSFELQRDIGWHTTLDAMYVGNHGSHEEISNGAANAFCCGAGQLPSNSPTFGDLPTAPPDPRFGQVTTVSNIANSNYHGLVTSVRHSFGGGFTFQASYTWSHALDEISNNSLSPFGLNTTGLYADVIFPQDPYNIRKYNYGNADYDVRHSFVANYVWDNALRHLTSAGPNVLLKGWSFSGTVFRHSGLPMTIFDNTDTSALSGSGYGAGTQYIFANVVGSPNPNCSGSAAEVDSAGNASHQCWGGMAGFSDPATTYGNQRRNQFRGPGFFDTDFAIEKGFGLPGWEGSQFSLGARFFNVLNHPNFDYPIMNANNPQVGQIIQTVSTPTSPFGSGLGADASPRIIQLQLKLTF